MIILLKLIDIFHGIWRAKRDSSSQVQIKDYSISPVITYNVEITSFRCCCINTKPVDVELTRLTTVKLGESWQNNDAVLTSWCWWNWGACVHMRVYLPFPQIFDFLCASLDDANFSKGSTLKGKNPRWVMIFFFKNWLPLKMVVKTTIEVASL